MELNVMAQGAPVRLACLRKGHGPPLLLLPGLGGLKEAWLPVMSELSGHHEVLALDLPGTGASGPMPDHVVSDTSSHTEVVAAAATALGLEKPHVAGNSLGGAIALELARRGVVASATALAPIGFWTALEAWYAAAAMTTARQLGRVLRPVLPLLLRPAPVRRSLLALMFRHGDRMSAADALRQVRGFVAADIVGRTLPQTRRYRYSGHQPPNVTICWGMKDRLLLPRQARRTRHKLPQARLQLLPDCGHVAMIDAPDLVARAILATTAA